MMCGACDGNGYSVWGRVMTEEEFSAGEKCVSLKGAEECWPPMETNWPWLN